MWRTGWCGFCEVCGGWGVDFTWKLLPNASLQCWKGKINVTGAKVKTGTEVQERRVTTGSALQKSGDLCQIWQQKSLTRECRGWNTLPNSYYITCLIMTLSRLHRNIIFQKIVITKFPREVAVYKIIRDHYIQQTAFGSQDFLTVFCR